MFRFVEILNYIIVHPGKAHHDEYLACAVLLAIYGDLPIYRRNPTIEELADPKVCCVDIGLRYEPELANFDHHQVRGMPCAFHLVMTALGLHEPARQLLPWYDFMGDMDAIGPEETAAKHGFERRLFDIFTSPIERAILSAFGHSDTVSTELRTICATVGKDFIKTIKELSPRLDALDDPQNATVIEINGVFGIVSYLEDRPSFGLDEYRASRRPELLFSVSRDNRGDGWSLHRWDGDQRVDFNKIRSDQRLRFVHLDGFCAKTHELLSVDELVELISGAVDPDAGQPG